MPAVNHRARSKCYKCPEPDCGKAFSRPCRLEEHRRSHSGDRPFSCQKSGCEMAFFRESHLRAHFRAIHSDERPFSCELCSKSFRTNQHLKRHLETTHAPKRFACHGYFIENEAECTATFSKQNALRKHIASQHLHQRPYQCSHDGCERSFDSNSRLNAHISKDHSVIPRYVCSHSECKISSQGGNDEELRRFPTWSALQKHIKADHKYQCNICNKTFTQLSVLKAHSDTHEHSLDERRLWKCETCERKFTRKYALKVHVKTVHDKSKAFSCPVSNCTHDFGHRRLLKQHLRLRHHLQLLTDNTAGEIIEGDDDKSGASISQVETNVSVEIQNMTDSIKSKRKSENNDALDEILGSNYKRLRSLRCLVSDCGSRFSRSYDLARHLATYHSHSSLPEGVNGTIMEKNDQSSSSSLKEKVESDNQSVVVVNNDEEEPEPWGRHGILRVIDIGCTDAAPI